LLHDLSHWLAGRGHVVTTISSVEGPALIEREGPVERRLFSRRHPLPFRSRLWNSSHIFAFQMRDHLLTSPYDAVYCLNYHDAWGATLARRRGAKFRLVYHLSGIPMRRYFRRIPVDGMVFRRVLRDADEVLAVSGFALEQLKDQYGRRGSLISAPTDLRPYDKLAKPAVEGAPGILFVGDADEPRKGAVLLAQAFSRMRREGFLCNLGYSGRCSVEVQAAILAQVPEEARPDVTFHGVGKVEDLPRLYSTASVVVNPAVWEAQGMVLTEALAAGTPVVGCKHAGTTDIVNDPRIGRLFAPGPFKVASTNITGLVEAIEQAINLSYEPNTSRRCRERARHFSWEKLGPLYEDKLAGTIE
jgi:phosphatidylinositol alpha-mannosyltransferase